MLISIKKKKSSLRLQLFINCFSQTMFLALAHGGQIKSTHGLQIEMFTDPWSRQFGGGFLMTWAAFKAYKKLPIVFVNGRIDSIKYVEMLRQNLTSFLSENDVFQQDNTPIHVFSYRIYSHIGRTPSL